MRVFIILDSKNYIPIVIYPLMAISEIKNMITKIKKIPFDEQELLYEGKPLDNDKIIKQYSISNGSVLILSNLNKKIDVYVNCISCMPDNKPIKISIDPDHSIGELKNAINKKNGFPLCTQILFFNDKELDDMYSLNEYSIQKGSEIYLFRKLFG